MHREANSSQPFSTGRREGHYISHLLLRDKLCQAEWLEAASVHDPQFVRARALGRAHPAGVGPGPPLATASILQGPRSSEVRPGLEGLPQRPPQGCGRSPQLLCAARRAWSPLQRPHTVLSGRPWPRPGVRM